MNSQVTPEESMEGRGAAPGKSALRNTRRAQNRESVTTELEWIGQHAKRSKGERFNNLLSHIQVPLLEEAYYRLRKDAAPGVDGVTWREYGEQLATRLRDLTARIHRGSYRPQPVSGASISSVSYGWARESCSKNCGQLTESPLSQARRRYSMQPSRSRSRPKPKQS